jgi:hypothetical protein
VSESLFAALRRFFKSERIARASGHRCALTSGTTESIQSRSVGRDWRPAQPDDCPACRGTKGRTVGPFCDAPYEHESIAECDCGSPAIFTRCRVCKGSGELVGLPRATYMARGGAAPVQRRGFA